MNSRERVAAALNHQEVDKVPIDCGAMRSTGIMAIAYAKLKKKLGIKSGHIRVYDFSQQLAEIEPEILDLFEVDVVDISNTLLYPDPRSWKEYMLPDGTQAEAPPEVFYESDGDGGYIVKHDNGFEWGRMPKGCLYFEVHQPPLGAPRKNVDEYQLYEFTDERLAWLQERSRYLFENTDYALMGGFGGNILELGQSIRGWGNFMMDLADGSGFAEELIDYITENHLRNLKLYLETLGDTIQLIQLGDDLGTQKGPQLSLPMFQKMILPSYKKIYSFIKENYPHIKIFLHSCGAIEPFIEDLIEVGVNALNPVQTSAANMDPNQLKQKYGDRITFWGGGCDTQHLLPSASPVDIENHVKERMEILKPGGGFVFTTIHNIQADVPAENIVAVYNAAKKYRNY
jgi:uroporphyrinogen decarboxylase